MTLCIVYFICFLTVGFAVDYYELLGITKDADNRDIRRAFKKLALKLHPDKIKDKNENAHEQFIAVNKAYEVLKDEQTRKKYDLYGEAGLKEDFGGSWKGNYHSWNYYSESFGIYDDDPEIITLNAQDFTQRIAESSDFWFVNFYSPQCSHCHHLAEDWRKLARELQDVIQVGAVNCEEDWMLCRNLNINSYPSLILYPKKEKYQGVREADDMVEYILQQLPNRIINLNSYDFSDMVSHEEYSKPWLVFLCKDSNSCFDKNELKKLGMIMDNLVNIAVVDQSNDKICKQISCTYPISYYEKLSSSETNDIFMDLNPSNFDLQIFVKRIYALLPNPDEISVPSLKVLIDHRTDHKSFFPNLIQFTKFHLKTEATDIELKRLKGQLPEISLGYFNCDKHPEICTSLYIRKFPTYIIFKKTGSYEFYHGTITTNNIVRFAKETLLSRVQTLTSEDFPTVVQSGETWFIDFFAPWCPPCMELLPKWRKISQSVKSVVKFGTVDCTAHVSLCRQYNINSYPTTILYNQSVAHIYNGHHSSNFINDFIEDILNPSVVSLSPSLFQSLVQSKKYNEIWVIDYFAPWCGPCQQLAPQWRKLARMLQDIPIIHVGEVNCQLHSSICDNMRINSYPTIHLYPSNSKGTERFFTYDGRSRDAVFLQSWIYTFLPSKVVALTTSMYKNVLADSRPWIIVFFAPWCSHCQVFAPAFEKIAQVIDGKVNLGKVNCEQYPNVCIMAGIRAYPTVLFYNGNKELSTQNPAGEEIGTLTYNGVYSFLDARLALSKLQKAPKDEL